jgi:hypothetical protein
MSGSALARSTNEASWRLLWVSKWATAASSYRYRSLEYPSGKIATQIANARVGKARHAGRVLGGHTRSLSYRNTVTMPVMAATTPAAAAMIVHRRMVR